MAKPRSQSMAEFIRMRDEEDLRSILKETWGKRFISRLLLSCGVHQTPVDFINTNQMYFLNGKQSIGNALLTEVMRINPDAYRDMTKMDKEDEDARRLESEQLAAAGND